MAKRTLENTLKSVRKYQQKLQHFYETNPLKFQLDGWYVTNREEYWEGVCFSPGGVIDETDCRGLLNIFRRGARGLKVTIPQRYKDAGYHF